MNLDLLRGLVQPDQRSCGPSALVAAHMLVDPGYRPDFPAEVVALHARLTSAWYGGHAQLPWPRALGTPPWAAARAMESFSGLPYDVRLVRLGPRAAAFDALFAAVTGGHPVPIYIGDWIPRHVVLAVAPCPIGVQVYNPGSGTVDDVSRPSFESAELTAFGRWTRPWFVVSPG